MSNAPWAPTGYGQQVGLIAPKLLELGHEIAIFGYYGHAGSPIDWNGIRIYGVASHPYGLDVMAAHATHFQADILITNMDIWVLDPEKFYGHRWVAWMPVDSEPPPPLVIDRAAKAWHRIVWTEFGKKSMERLNLPSSMIPYAVDCNIFQPGDKAVAKKTVGWPGDKFAVGMVAMNKGYPCRKAFHQNIEAFRRFHLKHPDSVLYLHTLDGTRPTGDTVDLMQFCKASGLEHHKDFIFADQYSMVLGYPQDAMAMLYNAMDVHLLVSMGEGFGVPQLEAQSCGTPVICGDWTTMSDIFFSGWKVPKSEAEPFWTLQNTYQFLPKIDAIVDALEKAYASRGNPDYAKRARKGAQKYHVDKIVEKYWKPELDVIQKKIDLGQAPNVDKLLEGLL